MTWIVGAIGLLATAFATNFTGIRDAVQPVLDLIGAGLQSVIPAFGSFTDVINEGGSIIDGVISVIEGGLRNFLITVGLLDPANWMTFRDGVRDWAFPNEVAKLHLLGKKIIVYEHGFGSAFDYELNNREPIADGYLVLGQESKNSLIRAGVDPSKILITGNPIYDDIKKTKHEGKEALFAPLHWVRDLRMYNVYVVDKEESYKTSGDPERTPMDNTYLEIGEKIPKEIPIDMDKYIKRPSVKLDIILDWVKTL